MFDKDKNLISLTLPKNFGQHITNASAMFLGSTMFYRLRSNGSTSDELNDPDGSLVESTNDLAGHWVNYQIHQYDGMLYTSDNSNDNERIKFLKGTLVNGNNFINNAPSDIKNANLLRFDSDVDTSHFNNASDMFANDENLTNLILPSDFGQNITNASDMFYDDQKTNLSLPNGFGQNIINASNMFFMTGLMNATFPDGFGQNITNASNMFKYSGPVNLRFPDGFGQNITNASGMFSNDDGSSTSSWNLINLTLPNGFGQNITNASAMFDDDSDLANLTLPNGFGQNITNAFAMFNDDSSFYHLKSDGNTSDQLNNAYSLLENTNDLAGHWINHQIKQYDGLSYQDDGNGTVEFTKGKLNWNSSQDGFLANAPSVIQNASTIKFDGGSDNSDQPNSKMDLSSLHDMANMFASDPNLQRLELNANFKSLKIKNLFNAFGEDPNLQSIDLSDLNTSDVTDMSNLFAGDYGLQSINFGSSWNTNNVTDMAAMFMDDRNLTSLDLSRFDTSKVTSTLDMFSGDQRITQLNLTNFNMNQVGNMGAMFYDMSDLNSLKVNPMQWNTLKVKDMNSLFARDKSLPTNNGFGLNITDPNGNLLSKFSSEVFFSTINVKDMNNMFFDIPTLKHLDLSIFPKLETNNVSDMSNMFGADNQLSDLKLGESFSTRNLKNDKWMFQMDNNLKHLDVPKYNQFHLDAAAMLSPNTYQVSTTLASLGNQRGQTVMKAIQANEPLVGDWFSTGTDTLEYYLGAQPTGSDIVSTQDFHGEQGQPDYTLMEMTSDALLGLDTSKYYLTAKGNGQVSGLAYKNLKFNGAVIPVQVAQLAQSDNTIDYTYQNQIVASDKLTGTKDTSDSDIIQTLEQIAQGNFINGNSDYCLTSESKATANQLAGHLYKYNGKSVKIPVGRITQNTINYVNSDNQTVGTQTFNGLDQQNDPYIDQVMHLLLKNPSDLGVLNAGVSDYVLSKQGIQDAQNALPPHALHAYGKADSNVTIHVGSTAVNTINCETSDGTTLASWTYRGRPGQSDSAMREQLKSLLTSSSDGHGN